MNLILEDESQKQLPFDKEQIAIKAIQAVIDYEHCPYEVEVNLVLTTDSAIHEINRMYREVDRPTDVLSFPMLEYEKPGDFSFLEARADCFHPDSGELLLGDIMISLDKVWEQAENYQHSVLREYAFLIVHSMLHLFGYDHMEREEAAVMEQKQEEIMNHIKITRTGRLEIENE